MKLLSSKLAQIFSNKWAVSSGGSAVHVVRAAEPVLLWAATCRAHGSITLLLGSHLNKFLLRANHWAVSFCGSTVHIISTAEPVNFWAASSWAHSSLTLLLGS